MKKSSEYRRIGRNILQNNWGNAVLVCLIVELVIGTLSASGIGGVVAWFVAGGLEVGLIAYFSKLYRNEHVEVTSMFNNFGENLVNNFIAYILVSLYTFLWSLLFIIPGIIKSFSYAMTMFIKSKNPTMNAKEAITLSREMMNGNKFKLFCLTFSFIGWVILSLLTLGIGFIFLTPYINAAKIAFFEDIYNNYNGNSFEIKIEKSSTTDEQHQDAPDIIIE